MPLTLIPKTEAEPLHPRLRRLLGRFRRVVVFRNGSCIALLIVLLVVLSTWLDWRFRLPSVVRAIALTGILATACLLSLRWLIGPWRRERDDLAMAHRLEKRFPELNDSVVSSVQFLEIPEEKQFGSRAFREEAIQFAVRSTDDIDFNEAVPSRWLKRSLFACLLVVAGAIWLLVRSPEVGAQALSRLFLPFNADEWPAKTSIEILSPQPLPYAQAEKNWFELRFKVRGVIPDRVTVAFWDDGARPVDQSYSISKNEQAAGETSLTVRLEPDRVLRNFQFRVSANDADTGWQRVDVHRLPFLVPRDGRPSPQIRLIYPEYTELPAEDLLDGSSAIETVTGTRVIIKAAVDRPVANARLIMIPAQPRLPAVAALCMFGSNSALSSAATIALAREIWKKTPVSLSADGRLIDIDFIPRFSGTYVLRFEDEAGFASERSFNIEVTPDPAPTVKLMRPSAERGSIDLTPDAEFDLIALVEDKRYAICQVFLEYRTRAGEPYHRLEMFDFPSVIAIVPALTDMMNLPLHFSNGHLSRFQNYVLNRTMPLRSFTHPDGSPLKEGDVLSIRVGANDFDNVNYSKAAGYSEEVDLQIVGKSQIDAALHQSLAQVRNELLLLRDLEREARVKVLETLKSLEQNGQLSREQLERLEKAEQLQQQIRAKLNVPNDGLRAQLARMRQAIVDNKLPPSGTTQRVEATVADLDRLADDQLPPIDQFLEKARKENAKSSLEHADRRQKEAEETIQAMLERLGSWSATGEIRGEARSILGELRKQMDLLAKLQQSLPTKESGSKREELPDDVRNRLDRSAVRPERIAHRARQLVENMNRRLEDVQKERKELLERTEKQEKEAKSKDDEANRQPKGSPEEQDLRKQADALREEAQNTRDSAETLQSEIDSLRRAIAEANGQGLPKLQEIPGAIRDNKLGDAQDKLQAAAADLDKVVETLENRSQPDEAERLRKRTKNAQTRLDKLIDAEERLQKKINAAKQLADPAQREEELKKLTREQEALRQETEDLIQRLSRTDNEQAAQELRRAEGQMEQSRQQLEQGQSSQENQDEILDRLDVAKEQLGPKEELAREKQTQVADLLRGIRDRQSAAIAEEKRLQEKVLKDRKWDKAVVENSLSGLIDQQDLLPKELRGAIEKHFASDPVFAHMLRQAADNMEAAVKRLKDRREDSIDQLNGMGAFDPELEAQADRAIRLRQELALKRLDQVLDAMKPAKEAPQPQPKQDAPEQKKTDDPPKMKPPNALPPVAQLKALRALQADIAERTAAFDKAHPDRTNLSPDELGELDALRKEQIDVAELVEEMMAATMMGD